MENVDLEQRAQEENKEIMNLVWEIIKHQEKLQPKKKKNIPSMQKFAGMTFRRIYQQLCTIPGSQYYGCRPQDLVSVINKSEATSYLYELIMLEVVDRSGLHLISEKSEESQSAKVQSYDSTSLKAIA